MIYKNIFKKRMYNVPKLKLMHQTSHTCRLFEVVVENNVFWGWQVLCHWCNVIACQSVCAEDGVVTDICPEDSLLKHKNNKSWAFKTLRSSDEYNCEGLVYQVVNFYLKHSDSQRVSQLVFVNDDGVSASSLHVNTGEGVQLGVNPVQPLVQQVWGGGRGSTGQTRPTTGKTTWNQRAMNCLSLPSVMPLGHTMLSVTRALRSTPLRPPFSILAGFPQSVQ